jgi:hypothetical protein
LYFAVKEMEAEVNNAEAFQTQSSKGVFKTKQKVFLLIYHF